MNTFSKLIALCLVTLLVVAPRVYGKPAPNKIKARDIIGTQGDVHVGPKFGLDEEKITALLQKERQKTIQEIGDLLKSGRPKNHEEILILTKQISALEAKLANTEKTLRDREAVLTETKQSLESEKLKNVAPTDQMKTALEKLDQGDSSAAEAVFAQVLERTDQHIEAGAEAAYRLGKLANDRVDYRAAQKYYEKAVQLAPDNSLYLNDVGLVAHDLGQYDKAIEYFENSLASNLKILSPEHPDVATNWNNLGLVWYSKGDYDKAIEYYEKSLASNLKTLGKEHPNVALAWNNLGLAWYSKGQFDKAIEYYDKALKVYLKTFG